MFVAIFSAERKTEASLVCGRDGCGSFAPDHRFRKPLHLLELRAELQKEQVRAGGFKLRHALGDLFRRADEAGTQAAVRHRVVFERDALLKLRS